MKTIWGLGRRKSSLARVRIAPGSGKIKVNDITPEEYFNSSTSLNIALMPLKTLNIAGKYDILVNVRGGGKSGQAGAMMLGLSRALISIEGNYESDLRSKGYLSRDPRMKERKKPGQKSARAHFQFSKR